jgi:hypothetical protein
VYIYNIRFFIYTIWNTWNQILVRIELIIHVNVITLNDDIHLNGPQILFYLKNYLTLGSNGYENPIYIFTIF